MRDGGVEDKLKSMISRILKGFADLCEFSFDTFLPHSGWGTTSSGGSVSNVLREVDVQVDFPLILWALHIYVHK